MVKLERAMEKLWREQAKLRKEVVALRSGVNALKKETGAIRTTLERLTLTIEEEAKSVVRRRVRERLNVDVELDRIFVDSMEVNIYGAAGDLCVVGEATVRLGPTLVSELLSRIEAIKRNRPDLLRRRIVKVIYADYATPEALEAAKKAKVWVLKWDEDLTPLAVEESW